MNRDAAMPVEEIAEQLAPQRRFRPYPESRDSGVEWLRHVPRRWDTVSLKRLFGEHGSVLISAAVTGKIDVRKEVQG